MYHCLHHIGNSFRRYRIILMLWGFVCCIMMDAKGQPCDDPTTFDVLDDQTIPLRGNSVTVSPLRFVQNYHTCVPVTFFFVDKGNDRPNWTFSCNNIGPQTLFIVAEADGKRSDPTPVTFHIADRTRPVINNISPLYPDGKDYYPTDLTCTARGIFSINASDNCTPDKQLIFSFIINGAPPISNINAFEFPVGTNYVICTVKDASGNVSRPYSFTVVVKDDLKPEAICIGTTDPVIVTLDALTGTAKINVTDIDGGSRDNCTPQSELELFLDKSNFNCNDLGTNTVTLTVKDKAGNTASCKATVNVHYAPSLNPQVTIREKEICSDDVAYLDLSHPGFESSTTPTTRWNWRASIPAGITPSDGLNGMKDGDNTISQLFTNSTNDADQVTYTITPTLLYSRFNRCPLLPIDVSLWVNPHPKLIDMDDATICNEAETMIPVQTSSTASPNAAVYFKWTATSNSSDVQGLSDSDIEHDVKVMSSIRQILNNQSVSDQDVIYTLFPSLHINGREDVCSSPHHQTVTITVMPTPVIDVQPIEDIVCNNQTIKFTFSSLNDLSDKGKWVSELDIVKADVNITSPSLPLALPLQQELPDFYQTFFNSTLDGRTVYYTFKPQIKIFQNGKICYAPEKNVTVPIHINPTPKMSANIPHSAQLCYDEGAQIDLRSLNNEIFGSFDYEIDVDYDKNEVLLDPFSINYSNQTATIVQPAFQNESDILQTVTYTIQPLIQINSTLHCPGEPIKKSVQQAPELKFDMVPKTFYGGLNISCFGNSDGEIEIKNLRGGWATNVNDYDIKWSENVKAGINPLHITGLSYGEYSITVKDKVIECKRFEEKTLTQPEVLRLLQPEMKRPDCKYSDGSIKINATGGTNPYKYEWNAPKIFYNYGDSSKFSNLKTGVYTITVIDPNQCTASATYNLQYNNDIGNFYMGNWRASSYGPDLNNKYYNTSCYGANDGILNPNPSGKLASAYTWKLDGKFYKDSIAPVGTFFSATKSDFRITDLKPGVYELIIIDNTGCELVSDTFRITQPSPIKFNESVPKYENNYEIQCFGDKNGRIFISDVSGAFGGSYEYRWNKPDGDISDIVQGASGQTSLGAGTYELSIINKFNCKTTVTYKLTEPPELIVKETIPNFNGFEIQCYGGTGNISLNVSGGGEGRYDYQWSTSDGSGLVPQNQNQTGLSPGTYIADISYSNGLCFKTEQFTLKSPPQMQNDSVVSGLKCYGDNNASIQINITGGVPSYTYLWSSSDGKLSDPGAQNQSNLTPAVYQLKVTDANNCVKMETYTFLEPAPVDPNLEAEDMSCYPGNDGYISARPFGGTPGYTYLWKHGSTTDKITGLLPGTYSITVTDANGCTGTASADIHIPLPLQVTAVAVSDYNKFHIDCYDHHTGKIVLNIQNGRGGYIYIWSTGDNTERIDNASAGDYSVTVTDRFNCTGNASVTLIQPDPLWGQSTITDVTCPGDNTGSIQALVGGGVMPYRYHWSNDAENTQNIDRLTAGTYQVRVTDSNNCFLDLQAIVTQPPKFTVDFKFNDAFCPETSDGDIRAVVSGGTPPYAYLWQDVAGGTSPNIADLRSGVYKLEVTDAMFCKHLENFELGYTSAECLRIPNAFSPNEDGFNDHWEIFVGDRNSSFRYPLRDVYPEAIVEVYSGKWGMLLYRSQKGYPEPWNGKFQGKYLPMDSYVYRIILSNHTKPITGNVFITR